MHTCRHILISLLIAASGTFAAAHDAERPMLSQAAVTIQRIGLTDVTVTYHRPAVKSRPLWGKLVPYDEIWRAGANEATTITFSDDVRINGRKLPAGTYSFFVKPGRDNWDLILNANAQQWGTFFLDKSKNVLTIQATPRTIPHEEWLLYTFSDLDITSGKLELRWGELAVGFTIQVDTVAKLARENQEVVDFACE